MRYPQAMIHCGIKLLNESSQSICILEVFQFKCSEYQLQKMKILLKLAKDINNETMVGSVWIFYIHECRQG